MDYNHYSTMMMEEFKSLGLLTKKSLSAIELLYEILQRLSLETLLKPSDSLTIRTVQESILVKKFLDEFDDLAPTVQQNPSLLLEKGKLLFAQGNFEKADQDFSMSACHTTEKKKQAIANYNQFQSLVQKNLFTEALTSYNQAVSLSPETCELFDSACYVPQKILDAAVWGVTFLCSSKSGGQCIIHSLMNQKDIDINELFQKLSTLRGIQNAYLWKIQKTAYVNANKNPYIVTDFIAGENLHHYVESIGEVTEDKVMPFFKKLAQTISAVHAAGIIHRDIKPKNILVVEKDGQIVPYLINWCLAIPKEKLREYYLALAKKGSSLSLTEHDIRESVEYASPEQKNEPVEGKMVTAGPYSDIYAFGKAMVYLLFKTTKPYAQHWQKLASQDLQEILEKCQMENPKNRYQNFKTVLTHLSAYSFGYEYYTTGNYEKAIPYFKTATEEEEHPLALFALAIMYESGEGLSFSEMNAEKYKRRALARAQIEEIKRSAQEEDVVAQIFCGYLYCHGEGIAQDFETAIGWFKKAAEKGYATAQLYLAHMYQHGQGVAQNWEEAARWLKKAAEKIHPLAQYNLGILYRYGRGVGKSFKEATQWYQKAAAKGCVAAQCSLAYMYQHGLGTACDYQEAILWAEEGVMQDFEEASRWYEQAARKGYPIAQTNLGCMYLYGCGVSQNLEKAHQWFQKAAKKGYRPAQYLLGYLYHHGLGQPQDETQSAKWLQQAEEKSDPQTRKLFQQILALTPQQISC